MIAFALFIIALASLGVSLSFSWLYTWSLPITIGWVLGLMLSTVGYLVLSRNFFRIPWEIGCKFITAIGMGSLSILVVIASVSSIAQALGAPVAMLQWGVAISSVGLISLSLFLNQYSPSIVTHTLRECVPPGTPPVRIIQITDIHLNGLKSVAWIQTLVDTINQEKPDIVVFTGDFSDISAQLIQGHCAALAAIQAPVKLAVSGNHDFYTGYLDFCSAMKTIGFEVLDNRGVTVGPVHFVGLPDQSGQQWGVERAPIQTLIPDDAHTVILLDHRPEAFTQHVLQYPTLIQLSGHTHAGQLPPWGALVWLRYRITAGWRRFGSARLYVSRGTSTWGPPMRLFKHGEVTLMLLRD